MPGISPIKVLANLTFFGEGQQLPTKEWTEKYYKDRKQEQGEQGFEVKTFPAVPNFKAPHPGYKYQQDTCNKIGKDFKDFMEAMLDAVQFAHTKWKTTSAKFDGLQVMAVCAIGQAGCLKGDALESDIKSAPSCSSFDGNMKKHRDAVAKGVSKCFKDWQDNVMVPGLPWYPAFAAFPSAMAPPMPNVPMPLIACISSKMTSIIMPDDMTSAMDDALDGKLKDMDKDKQYHSMHKAIATVLALAFLMWLPAKQVMLVMGKGPIPTFAPPYVPVGPVLNGDNIAAPGHLAA
jgi:hypothetical protein